MALSIETTFDKFLESCQESSLPVYQYFSDVYLKGKYKYTTRTGKKVYAGADL